MDVNNVKMLDIIPTFMRDDKTVQGLCAAADAMYKKLLNAMHISWWRLYIDELSSDELDEIAHAIGIGWYDDNSDVYVKRNVLKNCENIRFIAGTPEAVRFAVKDLFGDVEVQEWYEYGGEPFHFKLILNAKLTSDNTSRFQAAVDSSKNVRSILDSIENLRKANAGIYIGGHSVGVQICDIK